MPRRRPTKALESEPGLEFDFFLAEKLHMTVADMRERMTMHEYLHWSMYYSRKAQRRELERLRAGA